MEPVVHDYLIIGAGPAGLQMGHHLARAGRDVLILEAGAAPGTFFRSFPRHRTLISVNKVETGSDDPEINLRMDWNSLLGDSDDVRFTRYSARGVTLAVALRSSGWRSHGHHADSAPDESGQWNECIAHRRTRDDRRLRGDPGDLPRRLPD